MRISMITPCRSVTYPLCYFQSQAHVRRGEVLSGKGGKGLVCEAQTTPHWINRMGVEKGKLLYSLGQGHEVQGQGCQL